MKSFKAVLVASLVLGACEKSDNVSQLHQEAVDTAKFYAPQVDQLDKRRQEIFQHGRNVPGNLPDVPEIVKLITEAGDKVNEMKGITGSLEKQADEAAKANKLDELEKLNDESREKLDADWTIANEDLTKVEGWLWQYEQHRQLPPPPPPVPTPNDTGEPPPAAGQGSAATEKKADEKKPAEKAADKAATEKADKKGGDKAAAPKAEKAAAPKADKAAAPKAAGSAAK